MIQLGLTSTLHKLCDQQCLLLSAVIPATLLKWEVGSCHLEAFHQHSKGGWGLGFVKRHCPATTLSFSCRFLSHHPQRYQQQGFSSFQNKSTTHFWSMPSMHLLLLNEHSLFIDAWILPVCLLSLMNLPRLWHRGKSQRVSTRTIWRDSRWCLWGRGSMCVRSLWSACACPLTNMKIYGVWLTCIIHNKAVYFICKYLVLVFSLLMVKKRPKD